MNCRPNNTQTVQVVVYRGCQSEKCALDGKDLAWATSSKESNIGNRTYSKRDYKEYLLFNREVLPGLLRAVEAGRSAAILSTHTGMIRLVQDGLENQGGSRCRVRRSEAQKFPAVYLGDNDSPGIIDQVAVLIVDCYDRNGAAIELCLDYGVLHRASNVTILVAEELLRGGFAEASKLITESGNAFYRVMGELLAGQNNVSKDNRSYGIGQCFSGFNSNGKTLHVAKPRLADDMPSIFDGLKTKRVEQDGAENDGGQEWLTERLACDAFAQVVEDLYRNEPQLVKGLRVLRELHLDDLTGSLPHDFCQRALADGKGGLGSIARFALGRIPKPEPDGSFVDHHARFDFAFIDKNTGRLLLAIEIDGDLHRYCDYEETWPTIREKDEMKDEFVRQIGGLVLHGNSSEQYGQQELERTSFTLLRLPTDGSTFNEIEPSDDANAEAGRLSIRKLLQDRIEQAIPVSFHVLAPHRTVTELELENLQVPWDEAPETRSMEKTAGQTKRMKALGLIEMSDKRWRPTVKGRQMCGITLALFGANQAESCLYPDFTEARIERGWEEILKTAKNPNGQPASSTCIL